MTSRLLFGFLIILGLAACGPEADDQQDGPDTATTRAAIKGTWIVTYIDGDEPVTGRAFLDPDGGTAEAEFHNLLTGKTVKLDSEDLQVNGANVTIVWRDANEEPDRTFKPFGDNLRAGGRKVSLSLGDTEEEVELANPDPPDGSLISELTYYPASQGLEGTWRQPIDAVSGKAGNGQGREGIFRYGASDEGGADLTQDEWWRRPQPIIKHTVVINNQFAMGLTGPAYPYPYPKAGPEPEGAKTRMLFISGRELPQRRDDRIEIESLDDDVEYYVYALKSTYELEASLRASGRADTYWRDQGIERTDELMRNAPPELKRSRNDDFMILEATLKPGVKPGNKGLRINGVETAWQLKFGDHRATLGFARDLTLDLRDNPSLNQAEILMETKQTDIVYRDEQIFVEIRAEQDVTLTEFEVMIAKNGKPVMFNGKRELTASATTVSNESYRYRTPKIYLIKKGDRALYPPEALTIEVEPGDKLQTAVISERVLNLQAPFAQAMVLASPTGLLRAIGGKEAPEAMLWQEAVLKAAQCADIDDPQNMNVNQLSREAADYYRNFFIGTIWRDVETIVKTRINIGEHAGAIIMRPVFIEQMKQTRANYAKELSDEEIMGLRRLLRNDITQGNHPLENIEVEGPTGEPISLALTFYESDMEKNFGLTGEKLTRFQVRVMREARSKLLEAIDASLRRTRETDMCDVKEMLYLTGFSWDHVRRRTHAGLMKRKTISTTFNNTNGVPVTRMRATWVADRQARAHVNNVELVAETLRRFEREAGKQFDHFMIVTALLSLPIGIGAEALAIEGAVLGVLALDASDLAITLIQESTKQYDEYAEVEFALGASAVIGNRRLELARANDSSAVASYFKVVLSAGQVANGIGDFTSAARLQRSVKRGNRAIRKATFREGSIQGGAATLKPRQMLDIKNAILVARQRGAKLGLDRLNADEMRALAMGRQIEAAADAAAAARAAANRPDWAQRISAEAFIRLGDMVRRADVIGMVRANPAEMERLLMDNDALEVLRLPQENLAGFRRAVQRQKNRAPTRGRAFVEQASVQKGDPDDVIFGKINRSPGELDNHRTVTLQVYDGLTTKLPDGTVQPATMYGWFTRGRLPDTVFGTGKDLFSLEVAQTYRVRPRVAPNKGILDRPAGYRPGRAKYAPGPRWIRDVDIPLRDDAPGVPFVMFCNMRTFDALGFKYADPNLGGFMLKNIESANTAGQMHWLRHQYPTKSPEELFRYTHSYRYAENTAQQLGFRISEVKIDGDLYARTRSLEHIVNEGRWFDPGNARDPFDVDVARSKFLETYGVPDKPNAPINFDVYLKVEPL